WAPLGELVPDLLGGNLFDAQTLWAGALTLLGMAVVIRRGKAVSWVVLGLVVAMVVLGSHPAITVLHLDLIVAGFENLQGPGHATAIRPPALALGGVGALVVARGFGRWTDHEGSRPRSRSLRFMAAVVLAPLLGSVLQDGGRLLARPVGGIDT